jgi:thioester reductase-like protein
MVVALTAEGDGSAAAGELCHVVPGDITLPDLGIAEERLDEIRREVGSLYHLAAIYDLAVAEDLARRVNVEGTRNVLDFIRKIPGCRHNYVSTCYVAGEREGMVFEDELEKGQRFKNHYETTKYEAEVLVRQSMEEIETRIFRPSVVIGDSVTGETDKFDGPYFAFRGALMGLMHVMPGPGHAASNLVPVDFVVAALAKIPKQPNTTGKTFALADPEPYSVREVIELVAGRLGVRPPSLRVPPWVFKAILGRKFIADRIGIPVETVDYFNANVTFDATNTRIALEGTGVRCPSIKSYLNVVLRYFLDNVEVPWSIARH